MTILSKTEQLCKLHNITPQHSKGQNFLIEEVFYDQIITAAGITHDDLVLEVGPGLGFLTAKLAKQARKVVTVELDDKLALLLKSTISEQKLANVSIINGNVLDIDVGQSEEDYKIVANLPYNITSVFLRKFLEQVKNKPLSMTLMLQKEVAERIVARPGAMSILAISVQYYANAEIVVEKVPAKAFWPAPKVDSAVIHITTKNVTPDIKYTKDFFRLVKIGFSAKRKKLSHNLAAGFHIEKDEAILWMKGVGLSESLRAQELSLDDWRRLKKEGIYT
ncbi:MAG: 16S rRNA (adenine(1518)-N(6)/adenine(1519)-N(6))-dimethyltransferase RsmA [bacterium]